MISASGISLLGECDRKAGFRYWGEDYGYPEAVQAPAAAFGGEMHEVAEAYLRDGTAPDRLTKAGELFLAGLPWLPAPGAGGVEGTQNFTVAGIEYTTRVDYRGPVPRFEGNPAVVTLDHKTSSSPQRYGLWGKEAFLAHPQPLLYAVGGIKESGDAAAHLRWLYYRSKGTPAAFPSDVTLTRGEIEGAFENVIHVPAERLSRLKKERPDPLTLEPTPSQCSAYGGCPYRGVCNLSGEVRLKSALKEMNMLSLVEKMKQDQANRGKAPAAPATAPAAGKEDKINAPEARTALPEKKAIADIAPKSPIADTNTAVVVFEELSKAFAAMAKRLG